jgi:Protein of unknown function (DUF3775)
MPYDIDRDAVLTIIELDDQAKAAEARHLVARGGPEPYVLSLDNGTMLPTGLSAEEKLVYDALEELSDREQARILAMYWLGRASRWEPMGEETYQTFLAHAEDNLDDTPTHLASKSNLGDALRTAQSILGA